MEKLLNDELLEKVTGGENIIPIIFATKEKDEQILSLSYKGLHCPVCRHQFSVVVPPSGKVTCPECKHEFKVTT